jgi:hypothetical protein
VKIIKYTIEHILSENKGQWRIVHEFHSYEEANRHIKACKEWDLFTGKTDGNYEIKVVTANENNQADSR